MYCKYMPRVEGLGEENLKAVTGAHIYTLHLCMSSLPTGLIYAPEFRSCRKYINIFLPYFYYPLVARTIFDACIYI